ncbi:hypothetical protein CHUAL_012584 [Chamberlinius hualienensis]
MGLERKRSSRRSTFGRYQPPKKKTPSSRCKTCCRKFTAFMFSHVGLCGLVVGYSILGALAFVALEGKNESDTIVEVVSKREKTVNSLWEITYKLNILYKENWTRMVTEEIKSFQSDVIQAVKNGYDGDDAVENKKWSFSRAFLYSLTVITTIGYGNIAPRTPLGKIVTIVYAIIGIPLMLLYLTNIGDILAKSFKYLYSRICRCGGHSHHDAYKRRGAGGANAANNENYRAHHVVAHNSPNKQTGALSDVANKIVLGGGGGGVVGGGGGCHVSEDEVRIEAIPDGGGGGLGMEEDDGDGDYEKPRVTVPITLCLIILVGYIFGGAVLFSQWEGWDILDGSYFCFVTLSTIGFGDLVPGGNITDTGSHEKLVLCSLYLLVGMAVIAMCFNLMQEEVIHKVRSFGIRVGIIKAHDDEVD